MAAIVVVGYGRERGQTRRSSGCSVGPNPRLGNEFDALQLRGPRNGLPCVPAWATATRQDGVVWSPGYASRWPSSAPLRDLLGYRHWRPRSPSERRANETLRSRTLGGLQPWRPPRTR